MYFCIHYFDNNKIEEECNISQLSAEESDATIKSSRSAIIPENKQLLVNPNCPVGILLDYVCKETGINKEAEYDFCNIETGEFVGIKQYQQFDYATNLFTPKQIYVIIFLERDEIGLSVKYEPYINKLTKSYTDIIIRINRFVSTTRKKSTTKKYRRGSTGSTNSTTESTIITRRRSKKRGSTISKRSLTPHV